MKLVVPVNSYNEIDRLISEGADDFYMGYLDEKWTSKYSAFSGNRREFYSANFTNIGDLRKTVLKIHDAGLKVAVTMNDRYTEPQYEDLYPVIKMLIDKGVDAFILADLGLLLKFKEWNLKTGIHLSTGGGVLNPQTAMFYRDLGVDRIIFPRQLFLTEIKDIAESCPDIPFEIFGIYGRDPYIDAFCRFHHGINCVIPKLGPCGCIRLNETNFLIRNNNNTIDSFEEYKPFRELNHLQVDGCAACILPFIKIDNVSYIKIVGRGANSDRKIKGIKMLKYALQFSHTNESPKDVYKLCKEKFMEIYGEQCNKASCYYENYLLDLVGGY